MEFYLHLSPEEVREQIPYEVVCETMEGSRWNTYRRKRMFKELFTEREQQKAYELRPVAHRWYLTTGIPIGGVSMTKDTYLFWQKLGEFCASI